MSNRDNDDLIGFRDFLEDDDQKKKGSANKRIDNLNYELLAFLEKDASRLDKHISLFEEKTFMLKNFPVDSKIIVDLESENIELKIDIINLLKSNPSALHSNLSEILEDHFSSL